MRDFIINNVNSPDTIKLSVVIMNYVVALIAAFFILFTYKTTYTGTAYSRKFNLTLGTITIVTTMIMSIISNNIALSLGMVGALSIIRFRTAVKDIRDSSFIFWSIAVGIGAGVSQYALIGVGSVFIFLFMMLTKQSVMDERNLLIIQGHVVMQDRVELEVGLHFNKKAHKIIQNVSEDSCELIYTVQTKEIERANKKAMVSISQRLMEIDGVERVNLVEQSDDISR